MQMIRLMKAYDKLQMASLYAKDFSHWTESVRNIYEFKLIDDIGLKNKY